VTSFDHMLWPGENCRTEMGQNETLLGENAPLHFSGDQIHAKPLCDQKCSRISRHHYHLRGTPLQEMGKDMQRCAYKGCTAVRRRLLTPLELIAPDGAMGDRSKYQNFLKRRSLHWAPYEQLTNPAYKPEPSSIIHDPMILSNDESI